MADFDHIVSRPYVVNPDVCCERCAFGSGYHETWCPRFGEGVIDNLKEIDRIIEEIERIFREEGRTGPWKISNTS